MTNLNNAFIHRPIDNPQEIMLILNVIENERALRIRLLQPLIPKDIEAILQTLKAHRLDGPVDTPLELQIFLKALIKLGKIDPLGEVDTAEEAQILYRTLKSQGLIHDSLRDARDFQNPDQRPKNRPDINS